MNYLKAEHIKFKRSFSNKLLWIAPLMTTLFAWLLGGFTGLQPMTFYWWYDFMLPGTIAILCALSYQKEERAGRYYSVFSLPINLCKFEFSKALILVGKMLIAAMVLALFASISNVISPDFAVYSFGRNVVGSLCIVLASIWQIPFCLCLARKIGMMFLIIANALLGLVMPVIVGKSAFVWLFPHCWTAKLSESLMGIGINGTSLGATNFTWAIPVSIVLSITLFLALALLDASDFANRGVK